MRYWRDFAREVARAARSSRSSGCKRSLEFWRRARPDNVFEELGHGPFDHQVECIRTTNCYPRFYPAERVFPQSRAIALFKPKRHLVLSTLNCKRPEPRVAPPPTGIDFAPQDGGVVWSIRFIHEFIAGRLKSLSRRPVERLLERSACVRVDVPNGNGENGKSVPPYGRFCRKLVPNATFAFQLALCVTIFETPC